jgi:hypothetical protein
MQLMDIKGEIAWPAAKVWSVVSDFGGLKQWNPAVVSCELRGGGVGAERTFVSKVSTVVERIEALDNAAMRIAYSIVSGSTIPVRDGHVAISVRALGADRAEVRWTMEGEPDGASAADLRALLEKRYLGRLDDLRRFLSSAGSA